MNEQSPADDNPATARPRSGTLETNHSPRFHPVAIVFIIWLCVAFFPLRRSSLRQSFSSLLQCRPRRKCTVVVGALAEGTADSRLEARLEATWVAATLSAACTPVRASGHAIEDLRSINLPSEEIISAQIAFAIGASITSDSGAVSAAGGVDGLGGMPVTTIRTGGGILVHTTRTGPAKSSWQTR